MLQINENNWFYVVVAHKNSYYTVIVKNKSLSEFVDYLTGRFGYWAPCVYCEEILENFYDEVDALLDQYTSLGNMEVLE